ncbi:MAG: c-type cytochrome [Nitrospinae bacterium]|nr:c-type cytochrome [Nitrospinota bacterium]MBI5749179.1 c-type cytochrome [Nitrospinota bacterium]
MKIWKWGLLLATILIVPLYLTFTVLPDRVYAEHNHESHEHQALESSPDHEILEPRVPAGKMAETKALKNIVAVNAKTLSEAREIFTGKGTCYTCHGEKGKGDGENAGSMNPAPRDFTYTPWQKLRTDGEIFWAITNGTAGGESGMPPFGDMLSDEERWTLVNYIREFGKTGGLANNSSIKN